MQTLTLELAPDVYRHLREIADRLGQPPQAVAQSWLIERLALLLAVAGEDDRAKARQALDAAGLLSELGPNLQSLTNSTMRLEDIAASMARAGGKPLSEIIMEQRGAVE
jgi:predicted transcriptional regulator